MNCYILVTGFCPQQRGLCFDDKFLELCVVCQEAQKFSCDPFLKLTSFKRYLKIQADKIVPSIS